VSNRLPPRVSSVSIYVCCVGLLSAAGCGQSDPRDIVTENRLKSLVTAYLDHAVAKGAGPRNPAALQRCLENLAPFKLAGTTTNLDHPNAALTSARDGLPFVVCYGVSISQTPGTAAPAIAFEGRGDGVSRYVAFANGEVQCVSEEAVKTIID
jgi:hypothetical protein